VLRQINCVGRLLAVALLARAFFSPSLFFTSSTLFSEKVFYFAKIQKLGHSF